MPDLAKKCPILLTIFNIGSAYLFTYISLLLIGFGIAGLVLQTINNLTSGKFFLLFSPIFMMYLFNILQSSWRSFHSCIIQSIIYYETICLYEGIFWQRSLQLIVNIKLFSMSSSVFYYFTCGNDNTVVAWIAAILIFVTGVFYIIFGCCCSS